MYKFNYKNETYVPLFSGGLSHPTTVNFISEYIFLYEFKRLSSLSYMSQYISNVLSDNTLNTTQVLAMAETAIELTMLDGSKCFIDIDQWKNCLFFDIDDLRDFTSWFNNLVFSDGNNYDVTKLMFHCKVIKNRCGNGNFNYFFGLKTNSLIKQVVLGRDTMLQMKLRWGNTFSNPMKLIL